MDSASQDVKVLTSQHIYNMDLLNGGHVGNQPAFPGQAYGAGSKITLEQVDPSTFDDDSDDDDYSSGKGSKGTKKTRGRVKIKMEFIENKLRRYTTFSKRKTGIMKKVRLPFISPARIIKVVVGPYLVLHTIHRRGDRGVTPTKNMLYLEKF